MKTYGKRKQSQMTSIGLLLAILAFSFPLQAVDVSAVQSCNQYMVPKTVIRGKRIGQEACRMLEAEVEFQGRLLKRVEVGITGTLPGYTIKDAEARYSNYFNVYPEFVYPQAGVKVPVYHGIGRYTMEKGSGMTVLYPVARSQWNGKMFVTAHGGGRSFTRGNVPRWDKNLDPADPFGDISQYEKRMLEKGYAVAKTRRSTLHAKGGGGDLIVTLDDGTTLEAQNVTEQPPLIMSYAQLAENILQDRFGQKPRRTYWYGHSGGARPGRMVNYKAGLNVDEDGSPIIDGLIIDDAGAGLWLPIVMKGEQDVLFATAAERRRFVPMIEISHLLYMNETPDDPPAWRGSNNFLHNKRLNAKVLRDKGLGNKFRYYEIDGISHSGGEYLKDQRDGDVVVLPLYRLMDGFIDLLDNWVENGAAPPPSRSDWHELGDRNNDNIIENPAIDMPEVACPLGVYHPFPRSRGPQGQGTTGFAPFTGTGLEPLDGRGEYRSSLDTVNVSHGFVDMNHNEYRDYVETVSEAWQRLGLLEPGESFTRQHYVACVNRAVDQLVAEKFFTPETGDFYRQQARTISLPAK